MISAELNAIFQKALSYAKDQRHEYLTIEHVFFALLGSKEGVSIVKECGADANAIRAHKRPKKNVDFGFVGDVDTVNTYGIFKLLQAGFTPIFCALTHDGKGQMLNTNADTIAAEIAIAMSDQFETTLYYCWLFPPFSP